MNSKLGNNFLGRRYFASCLQDFHFQRHIFGQGMGGKKEVNLFIKLPINYEGGFGRDLKLLILHSRKSPFLRLFLICFNSHGTEQSRK